jgi:hypothetical protein
MFEILNEDLKETTSNSEDPIEAEDEHINLEAPKHQDIPTVPPNSLCIILQYQTLKLRCKFKGWTIH